jgi:hypothetical protein
VFSCLPERSEGVSCSNYCCLRRSINIFIPPWGHVVLPAGSWRIKWRCCWLECYSVTHIFSSSSAVLSDTQFNPNLLCYCSITTGSSGDGWRRPVNWTNQGWWRWQWVFLAQIGLENCEISLRGLPFMGIVGWLPSCELSIQWTFVVTSDTPWTSGRNTTVLTVL